MTIQGLKWIPGNDLESKIDSSYDRIHVIIWENDTTDICELAKIIDKAEKNLDVEIRIVDSFRFKTGYM